MLSLSESGFTGFKDLEDNYKIEVIIVKSFNQENHG